jgi:amino acid transporter
VSTEHAQSSTTTTDLLKRLLLGRQLTSQSAEHQLLPKVLALPVFSSDTLSSVAYATQEMMLVLVAAGATALSLKLPLALAVAGLLIIVVTSYRQTVRAYPRGGGSYIVARENLGTLPGLLAAAAILTDYVLTVAVSVTAGTDAITSAAPSLNDHRIIIAVSLVALVALANLRGVRESGTLFAVPTYGFVVIVGVTLVIGLIRCLAGCPVASTANLDLEVEVGVTIFLLARAFSSGASALTGVEAVADGVQAFRRPQSKNAAETLAIMGALAVTMFLGITVLAQVLQIRVNEHIAGTQSVLSQIGRTLFGEGILFYVLQVFTALILVLAANTAFQDFPRLSSILARDRFMPSQFKNRGDRLVFSNGVLILAAVASLLIWVYDANLTHLIQLYVVGVFTAFTLSQAGMVRRWIRIKGDGWKRRATINGIGAMTTGLVLVVVTLTKFIRGAWIVIVAMPVIVTFFWSVHRHYLRVARDLRWDPDQRVSVGRNIVVLLVKDLDASEAESLGYVRSLRVAELHVAAPGKEISAEMRERWRVFAGEAAPELEPLGGGGLVGSVRRYVRGLGAGRDDFVTVVLGEMVRGGLLTYLVRRRELVRLKAGLLRVPHVVVTDVPVVVRGGSPVGVDARPLIPGRTVTLVLVSSLSAATARAVAYARSLGATETRAMHLELDPEEAPALLRDWFSAELDVPLDIIEAPFRELGPPMIEEVRRFTADPQTVVNVILPEFLVTHWWELALHNQSALYVKRLLLFEERVILSSVPFALAAAPSLSPVPS